MTTIYLANDKYRASLRATFVDGVDTTLAVDAIPTNIPTIVTIGWNTQYETEFEITGTSGTNSSNYALTGITKVKGYSGNLAEGLAVNCLNNETFFNQYATGFIPNVTPGTAGNVLVSNGTNWVSGVGGVAFWNNVPGTPTRVSDTQFTITDAANANKYDLLFKKGTILKWDEGGTFQVGMVISSSYSSDAVTINIVGDSLTAGFTSMKYAIPMAKKETFIIPGTLPASALTNASKTWFVEEDVYILSADLRLATAGASTGSTIVDINDDGTTKFTTKPTITTTGTSDVDNVADNPSTAVAKDSAITVDVDSVTATAPTDAYIDVFYIPTSWRYRT